MKKLGFDFEEHRRDAQERMDKTTEMQAKYEANDIAKEANSIARDSLRNNRILSIIALIFSGLSLVIAAIALFHPN